MLNACNSRFLNPRLVATMGTTFPTTRSPTRSILGPRFLQIGTEGGYLPQPVLLKGMAGTQLLLAPAERADLLVDFSGIAAGTEFILYNDAPGPFPGGDGTLRLFTTNNSKTPWSGPATGPIPGP